MKKSYSFIILILIIQPFVSFASNDFNKWKKGYVLRAAKLGIPSSFVKKHLIDVKFLKEVILKDKNQVTSNRFIDYNKWIKKWLRQDHSRINMAREMLIKHGDLLSEVEKKYNVDKEIIVSLWGVETFYGTIMGDYDLITALSSLSYKSRRRKFFEKQLTATLRIFYQGHVSREDLKGSWAGATGQLQFMPSNFFGFAKDFDGDKKKDIWHNHGDIFASIAYYLKKRGWKKNKSVGTLVKKTRPLKLNFKRALSLNKYSKLGLRTLDGKKLKGKRRYKIATIPFSNSPLILKGPNYKAITGWNNSSLFVALNITILDSLSQLGKRSQKAPPK